MTKYQTFNATFLDLGLNNQIEWLLLNRGVGGYYASGFAQAYPLQFQKPIMFLFLPIYALDPGPLILILTGTLVLGAAAIPLFGFASRLLRSEREAAAIAICYLVFFPVVSANLFDFHWMDFFPLFFFLMAWGWAAGYRKLMYAGVLLTSCINPLALIIALSFLISINFPAPGTEIELSSLFQEAFHKFSREPGQVVAVAALLLVLIVYWHSGLLYTAGSGPSAASGGLVQAIFFNINDKLATFILLLSPFAFLSLYSKRGLLVVLPYVAFALYSTDSASYSSQLWYTLLGAAPMVFAAVDALGSIPGGKPTLLRARSTGPEEEYRLPRIVSPRRRALRTVLMMSAVFALIFFPLSPINGFVSGGFLGGNHELATISTPTPATEFLNRIVRLVPPSASVLTQNNIPQLSGRLGIQIAPTFLTGVPYNVILMDTALTYFSEPLSLIPYINSALANGSFGIVAEGQGALMVEQGFHGKPLLFQPSNLTYAGSSLIPYAGIGTIQGNVISGSGPGYALWYGPYATLPPGQYSCSFLLQTNETSSGNAPLLTLEVSANDGSSVISSQTVSALNFSTAFSPSLITLNFSLTNVTEGVEFRGMNPTGVALISLVQVNLRQN